MSVEELDLVDFEDGELNPRPPKRKKKRYGAPNFRKFTGVPVHNSIPFVIVPEIAPILKELADICAVECPPDNSLPDNATLGVGVLAARAALVLGQTTAAVERRLYSILRCKQLFINANFVEGCLMAMDAEHSYRYSEWPSSRSAALERVSFEAELKGQKVSPSKLLARANRLYEKGVRKALKHAPEVAS